MKLKRFEIRFEYNNNGAFNPFLRLSLVICFAVEEKGKTTMFRQEIFAPSDIPVFIRDKEVDFLSMKDIEEFWEKQYEEKMIRQLEKEKSFLGENS